MLKVEHVFPLLFFFLLLYTALAVESFRGGKRKITCLSLFQIVLNDLGGEETGGSSEGLLLESNPIFKMNNKNKKTNTNIHGKGENIKRARDKKAPLLMLTAHLLENQFAIFLLVVVQCYNAMESTVIEVR